MERRTLALAFGIALAAHAAAPPLAEAAPPAGFFYKLVCEKILHLFSRTEKHVDAAIEKVRGNANAIRELAGGNVNYYGSVLKSNYEPYLQDVELGLAEIAALARRAVEPKQAAIVREKVAVFRAAMVEPDVFDRAMDYFAGRMARVNQPTDVYAALKADYRKSYRRIHDLNLEATRIDWEFYWEASDLAFAAHIIQLRKDGVALAMKTDPALPAYNRMQKIMDDLNVQYTWSGIVVSSEESIVKMRLGQWIGPIEKGFAAGESLPFHQAIGSIKYEALKVLAMGRVTSSPREIDPAILASFVGAMRKLLEDGNLKHFDDYTRVETSADLAQYAKNLREAAIYRPHVESRLAEEIDALARVLRLSR